jgi:hypothetical protein
MVHNFSYKETANVVQAQVYRTKSGFPRDPIPHSQWLAVKEFEKKTEQFPSLSVNSLMSL